MRLTEKDKQSFIYNIDDYISSNLTGGYDLKGGSNICSVIEKLGQLEDMEERLGIDLIILAKGMKNGIYVRQGKKILKKEIKDIRYSKGLTVHYELNGKQYNKTGAIMILYGDYNSQYCDFTNVYTYGRDWALDKKELEK